MANNPDSSRKRSAENAGFSDDSDSAAAKYPKLVSSLSAWMRCSACCWVHGTQEITKMECARLNWKYNRLVAPNALKMERGACEQSSLESVVLCALKIVPPDAFLNAKMLTEGYFTTATDIGFGAFSGCISLRFMDLSEVRDIGRKAFKDCKKLEHVVMRNILFLGKECFLNCTALRRVEGAPVSVGESCFENCIKVSDINLGSCIEIGAQAFENTPDLKDVKFSPDAKSINWGAFHRSGLIRVVIDAPECIVDRHAFFHCIHLRIVWVRVRCIQREAFFGCYDLVIAAVFIHRPLSRQVPDKHEDAYAIEASAFGDCVHLKCFFTTAISIGNDCFTNCHELDWCNVFNATEFGYTCFDCVSPKMVCHISTAGPMSPPGLHNHLFQSATGVVQKLSLKVLRSSRSIRTAYMEFLYVSKFWSRLPHSFRYWVVIFLASLRQWTSREVEVPFEVKMVILSMLSFRDLSLLFLCKTFFSIDCPLYFY